MLVGADQAACAFRTVPLFPQESSAFRSNQLSENLVYFNKTLQNNNLLENSFVKR